MSKQINMSKPLTKADRDYMLSRDRVAEVAHNAAVHDIELPKAVVETIQARGISMPSREAVSAASEGSDSGSEPPDGDSGGSGPDTGPDGGTEPEAPAFGTEAWFEAATVPMFKAELKKRELPVSGTRDELADRLADALDSEEDLDEDDDEDEDDNS